MIITIARKPLKSNSVCENITLHNTGGLNINACRIPFDGSEDLNNWHSNRNKTTYAMVENVYDLGLKEFASKQSMGGRWPANVLLSKEDLGFGDVGGASRFFKKVKE